MRDELQVYLDKIDKNSKINILNSIFGNVHIRFELGGDEMFKIIRNGEEIEWWNDMRRMTKVDKQNRERHVRERVSQATLRATTLFNATFSNLETEIWVLIYKYEDNLFNQPTDFILNQFPLNTRKTFYDKLETVETCIVNTDEFGIDTREKIDVRIIIGKIKVKDIKAKNILNGIANNEMGFEPAVTEELYFIDPITDRGFHMYDDRGCYVWSDQSEKIKYLYKKYNDWIVDYHRPEIDQYFIGK